MKLIQAVALMTDLCFTLLKQTKSANLQEDGEMLHAPSISASTWEVKIILSTDGSSQIVVNQNM